jgi:heme exporter protein A
VLRVQGLSAWRDDRCLYRDVDLSLPTGTVMQIRGPNGAGKTTLLKHIAGLSGRRAGQVSWASTDSHDDRDTFTQQMLYLGHLPGVKSALTVAENLQALAACRGINLLTHTISQALNTVHLGGYDDMPCHQLSAGQLRRVALARLFTEPVPLWLLDEPFTAIDQAGVRELEGWLAAHSEQGGVVLLTTHHPLALNCPLQFLDLQPIVEDWH